MDRAALRNVQLFAVAAVFAPSLSLAATFPITVDPGGYAGSYYVVGDHFATGMGSFDLVPGTYSLDDGFTIPGSAVGFTVDNAGQVQSLDLTVAQAGGSTLQLRNTTITIDPAGSPLPYYPFAGTHAPQSGLGTITVIPGLAYGFDDGAFVGGSAFAYNVDAAGTVTCSTPSAQCSGSTLRLNTVPITVQPGSYTGSWALSPTRHTLYTGSQTFPLIANLSYAIDNGTFVGASAFGFQVLAGGGVVSLNTTAATGGAALTFNTVPVHIDAGGYPGTYKISQAGPFTGATDTSLINGLVVDVQLDTGADVVITPTTSGVTPPSFGFSNGAQNYTFGFGPSTGFTPPGSNVPVTSGPVTLTFSNVTTPGTTTVTTTGTAPSPPQGFRLNPRLQTYEDITTTATFSGAIQVCLSYAGLGVTRPTRLKLYHYQGGAWVNVTTSNDTVNDIICGSVTSLSPFGVFEEKRHHPKKGKKDKDDRDDDDD